MLDAYDAQMLDYHASDLDVQMNTSISSDQWVQEEAAMEDEGVHPTHKGTFEDISIEVDMEDYDGNLAEYDMIKSLQRVAEEGGAADLVDVELYDASRVHSPTVVPQSLPAEVHEVAPIANDSQQVQPSNQGGGGDTLAASAEVQLGDHESVSVPSGKLDDSSPAKEEQHTEFSVIDEVDRTDLTVTRSCHTEKDMPAANIQFATSTTETHLQNSDGVDFLDNGAKVNLANVEEKHVPADDAVEASEIDKPESDHVQEHSIYDTEHQDPHEISEGVYIDPPPSVILTIDIADHYNVILFNAVLDATTVEDGENKPGDSSSIVLLQSRPTLYYENLSSLFEALRQDTFLSNIPEVSEGELVLDAYDLQLVMPEDNCFARGISLHDVNILHDSYGLTGPLHLRLRLELPRFIIRYQRLQARTAQLLATESHVEPHQVHAQSLQDEPGHEYQNQEEYVAKPEDTTHHINDGGINDQVSLLEGEEKQENNEGHVGLQSSQQESITSEDSHPSEWLDNDAGLEYIENTETGPRVTATEPEVYEATGVTDEHEGIVARVVDVVEPAPAEDAEEASSADDDQEYNTGGSTPHASSDPAEIKAEQVITTIINDLSSEEVAGTSEIVQNIDPVTEGPESSVVRTANGIYEPLTPDLHEDTPDENVAELAGDFDRVGSESWDAEYDEEQDQDGEWEYEADQNQEDQDEQDEQDSTSVESSVTLSSRLSSKRSFHELDDDCEPVNYSPEPKKPRVE